MASRSPKVPHIVKVGATRYQVTEPDIYDKFSDVVGVVKKVDGDKIDFKTTVKALKAGGLIVSLRCTTETKKSHSILCVNSKISSALGDLIDKTIPETNGTNIENKKIKSANIVRKRNRY
jgi:hypothetical protein